MDIKRIDGVATGEERAAIDALLGPPRSAWDGGARGTARDAHVATVGGRESRAMRHLLLPALQALQRRIGWISEGGLGYVCDRLNVPPADAWGVATFYALLFTSPAPPRVIHVCDDIACKTRGADALTAALEQRVGPPRTVPAEKGTTAFSPLAGEKKGTTAFSEMGTTAFSAGEKRGQPPQHAGAAAWTRSPCLGKCDQAPAAFVTVAGDRPREVLLGHMTADAVEAILSGHDDARMMPPGSVVRQPIEALRLLRRVGRVDPDSLDAYRALGGFAALAKARAIGAEAVIAEVTASKLMGRGGAAFPTGRKWDAVRHQPAAPHYLVCNADESEPGTFKDRVLMEGDPFAIVEAMAIAAFATGCDKAFVYIRAEYPLAAARLAHAVAASHAAGLLGGLDIEIRRGAGAYICGEETAIFESIEGRRGEPRNKPPFPAQAGLFGKPTVVNNVETLANVPHIVLEGAAAFAAVGTAHSTGTRLFCLSGNIRFPGVYEAPLGIPLRSLIETAGGLEAGRDLRAVLLGGAAGTFLRPDEIDLRLTHEDTRAAGTTLGSGVVMVVDDSVDVRALLTRIAAFFRDESCGQCVPCRVGTIRQEEALHRLTLSRTRADAVAELALLADVGAAMRDASICGLGQTAYAAIESAIVRLKLYDAAGDAA
jgi:NADH-quinone oxidoreductase subunit F